MVYNHEMLEVRETTVFSDWLAALRNAEARTRVQARILRLRHGNFGDVKPVGEGISELRIDFGPGYRLYCVQRGAQLVILLAGGSKKTQDKDIKTALTLAKNL